MIEVRFECVKNKAKKYFWMLQAFKNIQKTDLSLLKSNNYYKKFIPVFNIFYYKKYIFD